MPSRSQELLNRFLHILDRNRQNPTARIEVYKDVFRIALGDRSPIDIEALESEFMRISGQAMIHSEEIDYARAEVLEEQKRT